MGTLQKAASVFLAVMVMATYVTYALSDEGKPHKGPESSGKPHEHRAPHDGKMAAMGSHHVEVVVETGSVIKVFLYDSEDRPVLVKGVSGQFHLTFPDNHRETLELVPSADYVYLSAKMKDQSHQNFKAILSMVINGQRQNVRLNL